MNLLVLVAIGVMIGIISGAIGLGGAIFLIPVLVYGYGMDQKSAQGTSLATLLLPIGALAFWKYYKGGHVNLQMAGLLAIGFFVGGYFGGTFAQVATSLQLRRIFAVCLTAIAIKMFLQK
ncbi:MAG TPA: sulfite exporter TauE/SafE family protein [Terracidiphilus sp.]